MKLRDVLIRTQLRTGFLLILMLVIIFGIFTQMQVNSMWKQSREMYEHSLVVRRALGEIKTELMAIHRDMKDIVFETKHQSQDELLKSIKASDAQIYSSIEILKQRYRGPKAEVDSLFYMIKTWEGIRERTIYLLNHGEKEEAIFRTQPSGVGGTHANELMALLGRISDTSAIIANKNFHTAYRHRKDIGRDTIVLILLTILACTLISLYLINLISKPLKEITYASDMYQSGRYDTRIKYDSENEIGTLARSLNSLAATLESELKAYEESATISNAMLTKDDLHQFCIELLKHLLQLSASQTAAIYMANAHSKILTPFETIGLNSECIRPIDTAVFEGELGLSLLNGDLMRIKDIPKDACYNFISTIGEIKPREIISIPIKNNFELIAVISISSIHGYSDKHLRLIRDILPTLSARLGGVLLANKTSTMAQRLEEQNTELEAQATELAKQTAELGKQNAELERQKQELGEVNQLKTTFLSNMSHELRTPLNSIIALSGVLGRSLQEKIPTKDYSYLEIIERNGKHLLSLINDVLDISRIEAGKVELDYRSFSVNSLMEELVEDISPPAIEKGLILITDFDPELPRVHSDHNKIRHIMQNLLGNAIKFTPMGEIKVFTRASESHIQIGVKDSGIGIAPDSLQSIFDEFKQADGSTSRRFGGTGLGLAIAKKYATLLGGTIEVESVLNEGSTFVFQLPIALQDSIDDVVPHSGNESHSIGTNLRNMPAHDNSEIKTIMIVEDSEPAIIQLQDILHRSGYKTLVASDGRQALDILEITVPDALILDLMMPVVDGFETLKQIRTKPHLSSLPVLILTAKHVTKAELSFLKGNNVYQLIQKGDVNKDELLGTVQAMLYPQERNKSHSNPNASIAFTRAYPPGRFGKDYKPLVLIVEDNEDNLLTIKALLGDDYRTLEAIDGKSGVEQAKEHHPDLILMDIALPVMNGFTALKKIRKIQDLQHIPIVAVTASVMKGNREEIMSIGFDGFIAKPIDHKIFFATLRGILYGTA